MAHFNRDLIRDKVIYWSIFLDQYLSYSAYRKSANVTVDCSLLVEIATGINSFEINLQIL
jgi:adenosine deaminase